MTSLKRLAHLTLLVFLLSIAIPAGVVQSDGGFPISWLWSWRGAPAHAATMSLVGMPIRQPKVDGEHHVDANATRAGGGAGRAPDRSGGLQAYMPHTPGVQPGLAGSAGRDAATVKSQRRNGNEDLITAADGSITRKVFGGRQNFRDTDGVWRPIDTRLVPRGNGFAMAANSLQVTIGGADLVKMTLPSGQSVAYDLRGAHLTTPEVTDSTAIYREVLAQTDLELVTTQDGVKETLILKSPRAVSQWQFPLRLNGLTARLAKDGSVELRDRSGKAVAWLPRGNMQDSNVDPKSGAPAESTAITYELRGGILTVKADRAWLQDPARKYPVRVDPTATTGTTGDVFVDNNASGPDHNGDNLPVGTWDGGSTKTRSFIHLDNFNSDGFLGAKVTQAKLKLFLSWTYSCTTARVFNVHAVNQAWTVAGLDAGSYPGPAISSPIGSLTVSDPGAACTNSAGDRSKGIWVTVPLTASVIDAWAKGGVNNGLALTASESDSYGWKRFTSANYSSGQYKPVLELTYTPNVAPQVDVRYPGNNFVATTLTPQLVARGHDPDSSPNLGLQYKFVVFDTAGAQLADSGWLNTTSWTVPAGKLKWGKTYLYTVQAYDKAAYSAVYPPYAFATPVPQQVLTSRLAQNENKGFDPGVGNYTTSATDVQVETIGPELEISRSYNSVDTRTMQALGRGWSSILDGRTTEVTDAAGAVQLVVVTYPDGQDVTFGREANGTFTPPSGRFATLVSASGYTLTDKDGTVYRFAQPDGSGKYRLTSITDANGRALTLTYNASNQATKITSASGRSLYLSWATPAGGNWAHPIEIYTDPATPGDTGTVRRWQYNYDNDNLVKVCAPTSAIYCSTYEYSWISQYANAVSNQGPASYWRLNEDANATMAASASPANAGVDNAVYSNVVLGQASGLDGSTAKAATFNGSSSHVQLPGKLVTDGSYQSISMWFKTTTPGGVLFSYSRDPLSVGTTTGNFTPGLYIGTDGKLRGEFWQGSAYDAITSAAPVTDGNWHHVVLSGAGNTQTLYLDGYAQGTLAGTIAQIVNGSNNVYIGAGFLGGTWPGQSNPVPAPVSYFNGAITDVAFFDRALSATTAADLHNIGKWPRSALTKIVRPLGGVTGQVAYDTASGRVTTVTDENGGVWTLGKPAIAGNSGVYAASVLGGKPSDYWRLGDVPGDADAVNEVAGGTAAYTGAVTLGSAGPFPDMKAAKLDGSTSYLELPSRDVPTTGPTTISMWFQLPQGNTAGGVLFGYQSMPMTDIDATGYWTPALYVGTDGKLRGGLWTGATSGVMTAATAVNDGKWHHVTLAAGSNSQTLYLDGVAAASSTATIVTTSATRAYVGAGKWAGGWPAHGTTTAGYFPGSIAEVAYYQAKLTAAAASGQFAAAQQAAPIAITRDATSVKPIPMPVSTVEVTDPGGRKLTYSYDVLNGHRTVAQTDSLGNTTKLGYDVGGFSNLVYDPLGVMTETISDVRGNTVKSITCQSQALNRCSTVHFTYFPDATTSVLTPDPRNDVILTMRDGRSASATDNTYLTGYTYDIKGNLTEVAEPLGRRTVTTYTDGTTTPAADGGFAPAGLPSTVVTAAGHIKRVSYFKSGDVASVTDAKGKVTRYGYDGLGNKVSETEVTDSFPSGVVTGYTYDAVGRILTETEPGAVNRVTGARHTAVSTVTYNADGLVTRQQIADATGGDAVRASVTAYNGFGQIESETDPTGKTSRYEYNAYGQMVKETEADGGVTLNSYDADGNLLTVKMQGFTGDPDNPSPAVDVVTLSKSYDPAGRLASETDAMGWTTRYTYTDNGLPVKMSRTDGTNTFVVEDNTYDAAGNVVTQVTNNGATTTTQTYDAAGRAVTSTLDPSGLKHAFVTAYSKDDHVLAEREVDAAGATVGLKEFMYDAEGNRIAETEYTSAGLTPAGRWKLIHNGSDASGNSPMTATGSVTWSTDRGGSAFFDGASRLSSVAPAVDSAASFTVAAWVNLSDNSELRRAVAANGERTSMFDLRYQQSTNKWVFVMKSADVDNAPGYSANSTAAPALNTWTHLAGTYDAATGAMSLYVNGTLNGTTTIPRTFTATGPMMVGSGFWNGGIVDPWKGGVSDVNVFQKALSATEIGQVRDGFVPAATVSRTSYTLDDDGLVKSAVDARGNVTDYAHDEDGRVTQVTSSAVQAESNGSAPASARPVRLIGYDTFDDVTHEQDPTGDVTVTAYDANGKELSSTLPSYTPPGTGTPIVARTSHTYDNLGQLSTVTDALGSKTTYTYDQLGRVSKVVDAKGGVTRHTYDLAGNLLSSTDSVGAVTSATYDHLGRVLTGTDVVRQPSTVQRTTAYSYGMGGWLSQTRSPAGVTTSTTYNAAGDPVTTTDGAGNVTTYTYDGAGRMTKVSNPDGTYTTHTFDLADRPLSTKSYSATGALMTSDTAAYDASDNVISTVDGRGTTTTFSYDAADSLVSQTQPISASDSIITSFGYDIEGKATRFSDGRGNRFITTYNPWGLPESVIEPATAAHPNAADRTFTTSYNALGLPVKETHPGGVTIDNTYDVMGNLTKQTGVGAEVATVDRTFGYDLAGRVTALSGNTLSYDDRDLLLSVTGPSGNSSFGYNADGLMASRTDAAGTTSYSYDTAGRLSVVDNPGIRATYSYNNMSLVSKIAYSGNSRDFTYDALHRVTLDELKTATGTSIAKIAYGWDANSNEISKTTTGFAGAATNTYTYDQADRLTSWNGTQYLYDKSGNRTQNGSKAFSYDERNRLIGGNGVSYTYTPRGSLRFATSGGVSLETQTDAFGQTLRQYASATGSASYSYDGLGRVIQPGFSYTGLDNDLAADGTAMYTRTPAGEVIGEKSGADQRLAWTDLHTDVVGQFGPTATTLAGSVAYDPMGKILNSIGMIGSLGFQSEWTDSLTGRVNMLSRWYNPETGQFDSRDAATNSPVPDSINANRYQYGDGNPMTTTDPTGHWGWNPIKAIKKAASSAWKATTSTVKRVVKTVKKTVKKVVKKVRKAVKKVVKRVYKAAKRVYKAAKRVYKAVKKKVSQGRKWVAKKYHQAKSYVKKKVKQAKQLASNIKKKAIAKLKAAGKVIKEAAGKISDAAAATGKWIQEHKAEIAGFAVGLAVGVGCGALIGWTGVGAVACGALAGAAGSLVTGAMKGQTGWQLAGNVLIGAATGALAGGLGSVLGQGLKAGLGAIGGSGLRSAFGALSSGGLKAGLSSARAEVGSIFSGKFAGGALSKGGGGLKGLFQRPATGCLHSFDPGTKVKMADGTTKPIAAVKIGDKVLSTDTMTGVTTGKPVVALHKNRDANLTNVNVRNVQTGTVTTLKTTQHHPLWNDATWSWVNAADLRAGMTLRTATGAKMVVEEVQNWLGDKEMRDLTVEDIHTYYVVVDSEPILVHNVNPNCPVHGAADLDGGTIAIGGNRRCICRNNQDERVAAQVDAALDEAEDLKRIDTQTRTGSQVTSRVDDTVTGSQGGAAEPFGTAAIVVTAVGIGATRAARAAPGAVRSAAGRVRGWFRRGS